MRRRRSSFRRGGRRSFRRGRGRSRGRRKMGLRLRAGFRM